MAGHRLQTRGVDLFGDGNGPAHGEVALPRAVALAAVVGYGTGMLMAFVWASGVGYDGLILVLAPAVGFIAGYVAATAVWMYASVRAATVVVGALATVAVTAVVVTATHQLVRAVFTSQLATVGGNPWHVPVVVVGMVLSLPVAAWVARLVLALLGRHPRQAR